MPKIKMRSPVDSIEIGKAFDEFVLSQTAKGVKEVTLNTYHYHFRSMSVYMSMDKRFSELTKADLDMLVVKMRNADLSPNTISSYLRVLKTFLNYCNERGYTTLSVPTYKQVEVVKEAYTDDELKALLKKPSSNCNFIEYRNWVIINFLMNCGCRAATIRNIQNQDVSLEHSCVVFRHTKNGKVQSIPMCSQMNSIMRSYMNIRGGEPTEYLFCNEYGEMCSDSALRQSIVRYNHNRGVKKTSLHLFRHTFARKYLVDCGGNPFTLQHLLGHSTLKMTRHYCAIYDTDIAKNYDQFSPLAQLTKPKDRIRK